MPKRRFESVTVEPVAEPVGLTADPDELTAAPVDHSTNGLLAVDDAVPDLPPVEWAAEIAKQESRRDTAQRALADIERKMGKARLQRALGKPQAFDALTEVHRLATEELADAESNIKMMQGELGNAEARVSAQELQRRTDAARGLVDEGLRDAVIFDDLLRQLGLVCERVERRNRTLSTYSDVTTISSNRLNSEGKYTASIFAVAPALAKMLGLPRFRPFNQHEALAVAESRTWHRFRGPINLPSLEEAKSGALPAADPASVKLRGAVARDVISAAGVVYQPGDILSPEALASFAPKNLAAMISIGKLEPLRAPKDSESDA
jgi:hypothetical protein